MKQLFVVYGLQRTYLEEGTFSFKLVLEPKLFEGGHDATWSLVDSDGRPMKADIQIWGRKLSFSFSITSDVADGPALLVVRVPDRSGKVRELKTSFWIVK